MHTQAPCNAADPSRTRLLAAAAACFAAKGYAGTSVRDITSRAGCNVSALTYHFGGKRKAYEAVFIQRLDELTRGRLAALESLGPRPALEQVLDTFARAFLAPLHGNPRGRETMTLLLREMVDGHLPTALVAERMVRPTLDALTDALSRACPGLELRHLQMCCHSLVSQLVHVLQVQRMHERGRAPGVASFDREDTVRHVVQFTAAGVHAYSGRATP